MEIYHTSRNCMCNSQNLPLDQVKLEEDKMQETDEVTAIYSEMPELEICLNGFGTIERTNNFQKKVVNGLSDNMFPDGTIAPNKINATVQCCNNLASAINPTSEQISLDAMNQYLEDGVHLTSNGHSQEIVNDNEAGNSVNIDNSKLYSKERNECIIALEAANCSQCQSCVSLKNNNCKKVNESEINKWLLPHSCHHNMEPQEDLDSYSNSSFLQQERFSSVQTWQDHVNPRNDMFSPEMDFLDFDFDPGPSGDENQGQDSDSSSGSCTPSPSRENNSCYVNKNDLDGASESNLHQCFVHNLSYQNLVSSPKYQNCLRSLVHSNLDIHSVEETGSDNTDSDSANMEACSERLLQRENSLFNIPNEEMDCEEYNLQTALLHSLSSKSIGNKQTVFSCDENSVDKNHGLSNHTEEAPIEKVMIWSELEACNRQVTQIGTSACGATAIINVLMALNISFDKEMVEKHIHTHLREENAPVATYLISRSNAGTTHEDLIDGVSKLTNDAIYGRFFHFYPSCEVNLLTWLGYWISKGAVPLATLNLQRGIPSGQSIPDAWHHQMIFGVGPNGIYLTNPLECVPLSQIKQQLCSESILLVRRHDVLSRWDENCDLSPLIIHSNPQWQEMNVIGQVINVLREAAAPLVPGYRRHLTTHIKIPAAYKSGITLFVHKNSDAYNELIKSKDF